METLARLVVMLPRKECSMLKMLLRCSAIAPWAGWVVVVFVC